MSWLTDLDSFAPLYSPLFSPLNQSFLIEGVLRSKKYLEKINGRTKKGSNTRG